VQFDGAPHDSSDNAPGAIDGMELCDTTGIKLVSSSLNSRSTVHTYHMAGNGDLRNLRIYEQSMIDSCGRCYPGRYRVWRNRAD
jgi:hypothetical protein